MSETHGNVEIKGSSDRSFGLVFTVVFVIVGLVPLLGDGQVRIWSLVVAALILAISFIRPTLLAPLNLVWFRFGMLLGKIMTPNPISIDAEDLAYEAALTMMQNKIHHLPVMADGKLIGMTTLPSVAPGDAVFHIAGQASIRLAYSDPQADLGVNVVGTVNATPNDTNPFDVVPDPDGPVVARRAAAEDDDVAEDVDGPAVVDDDDDDDGCADAGGAAATWCAAAWAPCGPARPRTPQQTGPAAG